EYANESGTTANKRDQTRVTVRRNYPQQRDPLVEDLRRAAQDLTAGDQNVERRATAALEKVVSAFQQSYGVCGGELGDGVGCDGPRIGGNPARARCKSTAERECCGGYIWI